jgi:hypothetical protein
LRRKLPPLFAKKETGCLQCVVDLQALCIIESLSFQMLQMFLVGEDLDQFKLYRGFT